MVDAFEAQLIQGAGYQRQNERTFIDKVLAKDDAKAIQDLIKKPKLSRGELLELLYLLSSTESKLLNYGEYDRYVVLKFFVWIREFIKIAELLYDYQDDLRIKGDKCECGKLAVNGVCACGNFRQVFQLSERTRRLLDNNERLIEHNAKFLIDLYLNIGRTSLSIGATGIMELVRNKFEISYPQAGQGLSQPEEKKTGLFGFGKG